MGFIAFSGRLSNNASKGQTANPPPGNEDFRVNQIQQWMQCAVDQAAQAETASSRASVGSRSLRLSAAYEAQCFADGARNWAQQATDRAYGASPAAQEAAANARNAASRAQAAADRARYYAETARE